MESNHYSMEEVMPMVSELAWKYTGCDHTSVTYEKAQMLMEAVLYCIHEYEGQESNVLLVKHVSAREAYEQGWTIVMDKLRKLQELYNQLIMDFKDYGSVCLRDTIWQGIPAFLENYDFKFAPQETLLTLDYPILREDTARSGISRVLCYVQCICLEQKFLQKMDEHDIIENLRRYHRDYGHLSENICEIVLQNMIGHMMLDKPLRETGFTREDLAVLKEILAGKTAEQIQVYGFKALEQLVIKYYDNDREMLEYLSCGIPDIMGRMQCCMEKL